jgi:AraC-like DNA-binding protein
LAMDEDGVIYAGGFNEFGCLYINKKGLRTYVNLSNILPEKERNFQDVWSTHATKDGICFITYNAIYYYRQGKIDTIPVKMHKFSNVVAGYLIIPMTTEEPLAFLKGKEVVRLPFPKHYSDLIRGNVNILPYCPGKILIMTFGSGIFIYDFDYALNNLEKLKTLPAEEIPDFLVERFPTEINDYVMLHRIYRSCQIHENSYALATISGGIVLFDQQGKLIQVINKERGLKQNWCWDVFADQSKNLWTALNNGISYIELSSPITCFSEITGLDEMAIVMCRFEDTVYIAAMNGIHYLPKYSLKNERDSNSFIRMNQHSFEAWSFAVQKGLLFAAAGHNGVLWIHHKKLIDIDSNRKELKDYTYCLGTSRKFPNHVFVGLRSGLGVLEIKDDAKITAQSFHYSKTGELKNFRTQIRSLAEDKYGNLWLTSDYQGIMCLKFTGTEPNQFETHLFYGTNGVPKESRQQIFVDDERILLGTNQGFLDATLSKNQNYRDIRFAPNQSLNSMLPKDFKVEVINMDTSKNIWFLGNGRFNLLKKENDTYHFIQTPFRKMFFFGAYFFTLEPSGIIWLCNDSGVYRYDPAIEKNYQQPFRTLIRKVTKRDGTVIFYGSFYQPQIKSSDLYPVLADQQHSDLIPVLPFQDNSLVFEYAAVYYEHSSANQYQYFLQGYDKTWKEWNTETRVTYTNLIEGNYNFQVKAKNIFDYESGVTGYRFRILPPWYRSVLAYLIYILGIIVIIALALIVHFRRVKQIMLQTSAKYEKALLSPEITEFFLNKILTYMQKDKPYLDSNIRLNTLAINLGISPSYLSQILNLKLNQNFYDFINHYRIKEAMIILSDPKKNDNILSVAFEVGFNSKQTFNSAFKKYTKVTPSQFKRKQEKDNS